MCRLLDLETSMLVFCRSDKAVIHAIWVENGWILARTMHNRINQTIIPRGTSVIKGVVDLGLLKEENSKEGETSFFHKWITQEHTNLKDRMINC